MSNENIAFGIYNKLEDSYFIGFDMHNDAEFGSKENAITFSSRLLAEAQALLLANIGSEGVQRKAVVLY